MDVKEILGHDLMSADDAYRTVVFDSDLKTLISIVDKRIRAAVEMRLDYVKIDTSNFHSRDIEAVYYELCDYISDNYGYSPYECFIVQGRFQLFQPDASLNDGYERYKIVKNIAFTQSLDLLWAYHNHIKPIIEMSNEEVLEIKKWDFYPEDLDEFIDVEFKYNNKKDLDKI